LGIENHQGLAGYPRIAVDDLGLCRMADIEESSFNGEQSARALRPHVHQRFGHGDAHPGRIGNDLHVVDVLFPVEVIERAHGQAKGGNAAAGHKTCLLSVRFFLPNQAGAGRERPCAGSAEQAPERRACRRARFEESSSIQSVRLGFCRVMPAVAVFPLGWLNSFHVIRQLSPLEVKVPAKPQYFPGESR
jgi:hypothetical protein